MSDISGPPLPKPVDPVNRTTGKTSSVSKDPQKPETQSKNDKGDTSTRNENTDPLRGREPAVSISPTAAHLYIGEELEEKVTKIDLEGRPIIVTETATFALRPDAGLRPGDDVKLEIIEAGKTISAELSGKNGRLIDPPVKLSLIVIAVHAKDTEHSEAAATGPSNLPPSGSYGPNKTAVSPNVAKGEYDDAVTQMLIARSSGAGLTNKSPELHALSPETKETANPDVVSGRSSSPDLATLIAAQQALNSTPEEQSTQSLTPTQPASDQGHLIPKSILTDLSTDVPPSSEIEAGLGQAIVAFSLSGHSKILQQIDPSISQVPPQQVAEVLAVRPLPPSEAKSLPIPLNELTTGGAALALVETTQGNFVAPLNTAQDLSGELVKITKNDAPASQETSISLSAVSYDGRLTPPGQTGKQNVSLVFTKANNTGNAAGVAIKALHTLRAFLTPEGPKTDFRIETVKGDIFATLPNAEKPVVGDLVQILARPVLQTTDQSLASSPLAASTAISSLGAHSWPALEQSFALLGSSDPATISGMVSRSVAGGSKLANSLLFFLSAAGRGDPEAWLGQPAAQALAGRDQNLLDTLKGEITKLMAASQDTTAEWRPVLLPFDTRAGDLSFIAMLLGQGQRQLDPDDQRGRGQNGRHSDEPPQRFIVEVQFSVLGAVQLDGVISERYFDLALRSQKELPQQLCCDATALFNQALAANGYEGQLSIVEERAFPVIVEDVLAKSLA